MRFILWFKRSIFAALTVSLLVFCSSCGAVFQTSNNSSTETLSLDTIPEYTGTPYVEIADNIPDFPEDDKNTEAFETYSKLDYLGRCGVAYANVCTEIMPTEKRGDIGQVRPSGWHTVKYDSVDGKYLYNRCHLIAYELAGENANEQNLITGTRYFNVDGMLPFENEVADFVHDTNYHVLYRVTPVYSGEDLVASGVQMEAWSVEDDGKGICFNVYVYNVQPDVAINYEDGDSMESDDIYALCGNPYDDVETVSVSEDEYTLDTQYQEDTEDYDKNEDTKDYDKNIEREYVVNKNTKKFHLPECDGVKAMKDSNKETVTNTGKELESMGYSACKMCLGE